MPAARRHVRELLEAMGADPSSRIVALDQPFAGNNPAAAFPFFEDTPPLYRAVAGVVGLWLGLAGCRLGLGSCG